MAVDNFWSNPGKLLPPQSMIQLDSPGDLQPGPIGQLPGTSAGALPPGYTTSAQTVYPWNFDYTDADRLDEYLDLRLNKLDQFSSWHSLYQARYLSTNGFFSIPTTPSPGTAPEAYYILLGDGRSVLNVMSLTLADYQKLSAQDKQRLMTVAPFTSFVRQNLGLAMKGENGSVLVDNVPSKIANLTALINASTTSTKQMPDADKDVFRKQLDIIIRRYNEAALVVSGNFEAEIGEITERFNRARNFAEVRDEVPVKTVFQSYVSEKKYTVLDSDVTGYAFSSDKGETVKSGYEAFMRAERAMLTSQLRREAISRNTSVFDPKADVAQLIYQLQLLYQSEADSRSDAGTEEMAQLHRLLSDYAIMQRLVNETLKAFNPKETDEKRRFMNIGEENNERRSVDTKQSTDDADDMSIVYSWNGQEEPVKGNADNNQFDAGPGFHWFLLAGKFGEARIGNGIIYQLDKDPSDADFIYESNDPGNSPVGEVYNYFAPRGDYWRNTSISVKSGGLTPEEMRIVGMFSGDLWGSGLKKQEHPIEALYGAPRPLQKLSDDTKDGFGSLTLQRRDYWDKWSTQLSDTVTILNQKNQLKQNEIESDTKQANRHFDLGNNALRKMNEMLMSIGRM